MNSQNNLTDEQCQAIYQELLRGTRNGVLKQGDLSKIARKLQINRSTSFRVWELTKRGLTQCSVDANVQIRIKLNSERKKLSCRVLDDRIVQLRSFRDKPRGVWQYQIIS